jgi:hypothetical protein
MSASLDALVLTFNITWNYLIQVGVLIRVTTIAELKIVY